MGIKTDTNLSKEEHIKLIKTSTKLSKESTKSCKDKHKIIKWKGYKSKNLSKEWEKMQNEIRKDDKSRN